MKNPKEMTLTEWNRAWALASLQVALGLGTLIVLIQVLSH